MSFYTLLYTAGTSFDLSKYLRALRTPTGKFSFIYS